MQKKKSWFTLVELLIVVVIIGILSAALLPRLTGHMARTRDLKRQTDLRNIAAAIILYQNHNGLKLQKVLPESVDKRSVSIKESLKKTAAGSVQDIRPSLEEYMSELPRDPKDNHSLAEINRNCRPPKALSCTYDASLIKEGEYMFYQLVTDVGGNLGRTFLIAKVETPNAANRVGNYILGYSPTFSYEAGAQEWFRYLCSSVTKGERTVMASKVNGDCVYSSVDELYYILEV